MIACEKLGKTAYLFEVRRNYVDVIVKRWQGFTGQKAVHAESGKTFDEVSNGDQQA